MPPVLAVLFWIWLLISIVVLLRRRALRRAARGDEALAGAASTEAAVDTPEAPEVPDAEPAEQWVTASVGGPEEPAEAPTPAAAPATAASLPPIESLRPTPRGAPGAGIADALVGIRMPCDLVPLVVDRLATDRITLSTTGHPAEEVGTALADEVERLGYVLRPLSDREVIATRGATEMRLTIRAAGADGFHAEHPTAREDSVVVEIALA